MPNDDVPNPASFQSALYGAVRFAECFLEAQGAAGFRLSRVICTPNARLWSLAFGEHVFEVEVLDDGFSVRAARTLTAAAPSRAA